jgi:hypothetical protein
VSVPDPNLKKPELGMPKWLFYTLIAKGVVLALIIIGVTIYLGR